MKSVLEKLLAITNLVSKQEWIIILPKLKVEYQHANSRLMSLITQNQTIFNVLSCSP